MKIRKVLSKIWVPVMLCVMMGWGCNSNPGHQKQNADSSGSPAPQLSGNSSGEQGFSKAGGFAFSLLHLPERKKMAIGSQLSLIPYKEGGNANVDSVRIYQNTRFVSTIRMHDTLRLRLDDVSLGRNHFRAVAYLPDRLRSSTNTVIEVLSDIRPEAYAFEVRKKYRHDKKAYTQGLVWEDGFLYEGTGQYGSSSLRKINLRQEKVIMSLNLPGNVFGEGICIYGDNIIQLTWHSSKGFVYDKNSFQLIRDFTYFTEGWGITTDGSRLIMSDGSHRLYYLDPEYYTEVKQVQVYNHEGPVNALNELEYINGSIYANIYQKNHLVKIDPETGKVLARIDLTRLVPPHLINDTDKVLNGIAHHNAHNTLLVTGKMWPVLYEIALVKGDL